MRIEHSKGVKFETINWIRNAKLACIPNKFDLSYLFISVVNDTLATVR